MKYIAKLLLGSTTTPYPESEIQYDFLGRLNHFAHKGESLTVLSPIDMFEALYLHLKLRPGDVVNKTDKPVSFLIGKLIASAYFYLDGVECSLNKPIFVEI